MLAAVNVRTEAATVPDRTSAGKHSNEAHHPPYPWSCPGAPSSCKCSLLSWAARSNSDAAVPHHSTCGNSGKVISLKAGSMSASNLIPGTYTALHCAQCPAQRVDLLVHTSWPKQGPRCLPKVQVTRGSCP